MKSSDKKAAGPRRQLQTFWCKSGWDRLGLAYSKSEFAKATGCHPDDANTTEDLEHVALARAAGHGVYLERHGKGEWQARISRVVQANQARDAARALATGNGNWPSLTIRVQAGARHGRPSRLVVIDGEVRGSWSRQGSWLVLCDTTGKTCLFQTHWFVRDGALMNFDSKKPTQCSMLGWSEALAIRNALQAWEEGELPPVAEQQAAARQREASKKADQTAKSMLHRLEPHVMDLQALLASDTRPEAARLLAILGGQEPTA